MKEIDKIAFIELRNGELLSTLSKGKTKYYIPGGKREQGETDHETLIREVKEELSVTIYPKTIKYLGTFTAQSDGAENGVMVKMTCYTGSFKGELKASSEIAELRWLSFNDLNLVSEVDKIIFAFLKDHKLIV